MRHLKVVVLVALISCVSDKKVEFYSNGAIMSEGKIIDGKKEGFWIEYSMEGDTTVKEYYENGKLEGEKSFFDNNKLSEMRTFSKGVENGLRVLYFSNGEIMAQGSVVNGNQHGDWVTYYENKKVRSQFTLNNGTSIGKSINFYKNGIVSTEIDYMDSIDIVKYYDSLGNLAWHLHVKEDIIIDTIEYDQKILDGIDYGDE